MGTDVEEFIFGEGTTYEVEVKTEVEESTTVEESVEEEIEITNEEMNLFGVIECVDEPEVACYRIALENEQNYNAILNSFMCKEFSVLESTGVEMVYEAADVKSFFKYVKETIAKWWAKIQGVIKKVMDEIAKFVDVDAKFVKKYKGQYMQLPDKAKVFKGYDFSKVNHAPDYSNIAGVVKLSVDMGIKKIGTITDEEANEFVDKFKEEFKGTKDKMRAIACGESGAVSEDEFDKKLKVALFGSEDKVAIGLTERPFSKLLEELESAKIAKAAAKHAHAKAQEAVKELLKDVKYAESALVKGNKKGGVKVGKCLTDSINASLNIMSKTMHMETRAIMTNLRQNRSMAAFYVMSQPKAAKESAVEDDLGIVLI